jgi:hypothetical protein
MTDKPEQPAPLAAASTGTITCTNCGTINRAGSLACSNCRHSLVGADKDGISTKQFGENPLPSTAALPSTTPLPQPPQTPVNTVDVASIGVQTPSTSVPARPTVKIDEIISAIRTAGTDVFDTDMVLRMEVDGATQPIVFQPKPETSIGRRDPVTGIIPDIDLTMYAGYRMGVSRKHCVLRLKDRKIEVVDGGSSNGTSLNGTRLTPHTPYTLRDGDELTLGKMTLRLIFQKRRA